MNLNKIPKKLIGDDNERAVSPVIGVILMVAITVILAAVIAAFVLDIGPGDADPTGSVGISGDGTQSVTVNLESVGGTADGVAIVSESPDEVNGLEDDQDQNVFATMETTGEEVDIDSSDIHQDVEEDDTTEFTVRAYSGEIEEEDDIADANSQAIIDEFEVEGEGE